MNTISTYDKIKSIKSRPSDINNNNIIEEF
ncbi:hypothetical protein HMPREF9711_02083 [Myroides odoratimimus CCUG 3837]|nr:hypothetical protein HMPREF9711_02083 [Myroides odoratimimus CCUG 3837]